MTTLHIATQGLLAGPRLIAVQGLLIEEAIVEYREILASLSMLEIGAGASAREISAGVSRRQLVCSVTSPRNS